MTRSRAWRALLMVALLAAPASVRGAADEPVPSTDEQVAFLKGARVIASRPIGKGITGALRLTLSDGRLTHDAAFQTVEQRTTQADLRQGNRHAGELLFADSFHYNIAAWELARLLNLEAMMPPTAERWLGGKPGAVSWWVDDVLMDEAERERTATNPPRDLLLSMVRQRMRMQVFAELVHDTDRNKGNVIYTRDWRVVMLDFTRAFRLQTALRVPEALTSCDRSLLARLRRLTRPEVSKAAGSHLTGSEVESMMKRRDVIVQHFDRLIAEKGEARVLY